MRGDVWVAINKNGEKVLHIDNGKFVKKSVIKPKAKFKIKQQMKSKKSPQFITEGFIKTI